MEDLLREISQCRLCEAELPFGPRPTVQASTSAKILVVGQAPGRLVHETGIPFNDPSGDRLRAWMGVDRETFYDSSKIALLPMAFCFPGTGKSGAGDQGDGKPHSALQNLRQGHGLRPVMKAEPRRLSAKPEDCFAIGPALLKGGLCRIAVMLPGQPVHLVETDVHGAV